MSFGKILTKVATVVGYATLAVGAFIVAEAAVKTVQDELEERRFERELAQPSPYNKDVTVGEWMDDQYRRFDGNNGHQE